MTNALTIARATYRPVTLRPLYYVTLAVAAVCIFCSSFLTQFTFSMEEQMVREMGFATLVLWGFLVTVLLSGLVVTEELENRTAVMLLSKPLRRSAFLLGKYFGLMAAATAGLIVLGAVLFYTLWWMSKSDLFGDPELARGCFAAAVSLLVLGLTLAGWGRRRSLRAEARSAARAPRHLQWIGKSLVAAGSVCFLLWIEFARGEPSAGDRQWQALLSGGAVESVWDFPAAFMRENGILVLEGLLLCILQVGVLGAVCVSLSAFLPSAVSATAAVLLYVLGNLILPMQESLKRLDNGIVNVLAKAAGLILPNLGVLNLQTHFSEGRMMGPAYLGLATLHSMIYAAIVLTVSCSLFERREIR